MLFAYDERVEPLLIDVPESLETERLIVRAPRAGDGAALFAAVAASEDDVSPWMSWTKEIADVEAAERRVREWRVKWAQRVELPMLVFEKGSGGFVGSNGLHHIDWKVPKFEIGYWTAVAFGRRGYATEATRAVATLAFDVLGARRVQIRCEPSNVRSRRVAEGAGFVHEATLKHDIPALDADVRDAIVYSRVR